LTTIRPAAGILLSVLVLALPIPVLGAAGAPRADDRATLEARVAAGPALSALTAYAYLANPMIRAARAGYDAAVESIPVMAGWPDPKLAFEKSLDTDMWKATLSQGIPLPGATGAASDAASAEARAAGLELSKAVRDAVLAVRESFHELSYLREARALAAKNRELLGQVLSAGETDFARDRTALSEVLRARSQEAQVEYDDVLLSELAAAETARLNALLDRPSDATIGPLGGPLGVPPLPDIAYSTGEIERFALTDREEILQAEQEVLRARALARSAFYDNLPMLELGGSYEKGGNRNVMASISLPLWLGKSSGRSAAARAREAQAEAMRDQARAETRALARELLFRARNARRLTVLYQETLLPQAVRAMDTAREWHRQGTGTFADYVETAAAYYNFQLAAARARADYGKALARLEAAAGRLLTGREIKP
jgi:cobalt-zinc-cadmium efflux system outer membrane protein